MNKASLMMLLLASPANDALLAAGAAPNPTNEYALWLIPSLEYQQRIQQKITKLAEQYTTNDLCIPTFAPHATLGTVKLTEKQRNSLEKTLSDFCAKQEQVALPIIEPTVGHRTNWNQFLFLPLQTNAIFSAAEAAFSNFRFSLPKNKTRDGSLMPHASLMYCPTNRLGDFTDPVIARLKEEVRTDFHRADPIRFEAIDVVYPVLGYWECIFNPPCQTSGVNTNWVSIYTCKLRPQGNLDVRGGKESPRK